MKSTIATLLLLGSLLCTGAEARDLQQVLNTGTLRVGVTLYPPWAVRSSNGEIVGFEVDVAKQLAADLKVKADLLFHLRSLLLLNACKALIDCLPNLRGELQCCKTVLDQRWSIT